MPRYLYEYEITDPNGVFDLDPTVAAIMAVPGVVSLSGEWLDSDTAKVRVLFGYDDDPYVVIESAQKLIDEAGGVVEVRGGRSVFANAASVAAFESVVPTYA